MKEETLEEFIKRQLSLGKYQDQESAIKYSIELGANWQQERMYSEEDMVKSFIAGVDCDSSGGKNFEQFIEQFKNK